MPDAPRKPGRPRKVVEPESTTEVAPEPKPAPVNTPPGPIHAEMRIAPVGQQTKMVWSQRLYEPPVFDRQDDRVIITCMLRPAE